MSSKNMGAGSRPATLEQMSSEMAIKNSSSKHQKSTSRSKKKAKNSKILVDENLMIPDESNGFGSALITESGGSKKKKDKKVKKEKKKKSRRNKAESGDLIGDGDQVASRGGSKLSRARKGRMNAELEATLTAIE